MIPKHQTLHSAGADLSANETITIQPNQVELVGTGFKLTDLEEDLSQYTDLYFVLSARSSLPMKKGLMLANGIGVIDADYQDEIKIMLYNFKSIPVTIKKGERLAQLIPTKFLPSIFETVNNERVGGFGSTNHNTDPSFAG